VQLVRIEGHRLHVRGVDLLEGTPILDIKPYVPYADAFPSSRAGWIDQLLPDELQFAKRPPKPDE
jgi:tRNA (Thr-GGU) A37 N-methylase